MISAATRHPQTRQPEPLTHHFHIYLSISRNSPGTLIITGGAFSANSHGQTPRLYLLDPRRPKLDTVPTHALTPPLTAAAYTRSGHHRVPDSSQTQRLWLLKTASSARPVHWALHILHFPILLHLGLSPRFANFCLRQLERRTGKNFPVFTPPATTLPLPLTNVRPSVIRQSD